MIELYLPLKLERDMKGRFVKGHTVYYTGKKCSARKKRILRSKSKQAIKDGRLEVPVNKGRSVVAIKDGELLGTYTSCAEISRKLGISRGVINRVCRGERNHHLGIRYFYEDDKDWINYLNDYGKL